MSADNGIYVLKTPKPQKIGEHEYRVRHAQAIDNIFYEHPNGNPVEVVQCFGSCEVFVDRDLAFKEAQQQAEGYEILEYGISTIELPFPFEYYEKVARTQVDDELSRAYTEWNKEKQFFKGKEIALRSALHNWFFMRIQEKG